MPESIAQPAVSVKMRPKQFIPEMRTGLARAGFAAIWGCWGHWGYWGYWGHWGHFSLRLCGKNRGTGGKVRVNFPGVCE